MVEFFDLILSNPLPFLALLFSFISLMFSLLSILKW